MIRLDESVLAVNTNRSALGPGETREVDAAHGSAAPDLALPQLLPVDQFLTGESLVTNTGLSMCLHLTICVEWPTWEGFGLRCGRFYDRVA